jgi:hypothetical protein
MINIPKNYVPISFEDYSKLIKENYSDSIYVNLITREMENFKIAFPVYSMIYDTHNVENKLLITYMSNPKVNKFTKDELANYLIKEMKKKGANEQFTYQNMESRLINDWLIKIKGKVKYSNFEKPKYLTQYMASNFGAFVTSEKAEFDFEKELTE